MHSAENGEPCPAVLRCPDRTLCPTACQEAGSREDPDHRPPPRAEKDATAPKWSDLFGIAPDYVPTCSVDCGICGGPLAKVGTSRCYEAHGVLPPGTTEGGPQ